MGSGIEGYWPVGEARRGLGAKGESADAAQSTHGMMYSAGHSAAPQNPICRRHRNERRGQQKEQRHKDKGITSGGRCCCCRSGGRC